MIEGYQLRNEQDMERLAWHAANTMNVHLKRKVTIKQLLGKGPKRQTDDEKAKQLAKLGKAIEKTRKTKGRQLD